MGFLDWLGSDPTPVPEGAPSPDTERQLLLYKYDTCGYCARVQQTIDKLGLELEYRDTIRDLGARQELMERTGRGTVPCLFIDGEALFETTDIIAWLEAYAKR
jgi:glutaredoxin